MSDWWIQENQPDEATYAAAVRIGEREGYVSAALLQRRLFLGYTRARLIVERMDAEGRLGRPCSPNGVLRQVVPIADHSRMDWESPAPTERTAP